MRLIAPARQAALAASLALAPLALSTVAAHAEGCCIVRNPAAQSAPGQRFVCVTAQAAACAAAPRYVAFLTNAVCANPGYSLPICETNVTPLAVEQSERAQRPIAAQYLTLRTQ